MHWIIEHLHNFEWLQIIIFIASKLVILHIFSNYALSSALVVSILHSKKSL